MENLKMHNPPHPGEIIRALYLEPLSLTITDTAEQLKVSRKAFSDLVNGHSSVSVEMAERLSMAFGTTIEHWMKLQMQYDLWQAKQNKKNHFKIPLLLHDPMLVHA